MITKRDYSTLPKADNTPGVLTCSHLLRLRFDPQLLASPSTVRIKKENGGHEH